MIEVTSQYFPGSPWLELKFVAEKETALALFAAREPLLLLLLDGRICRSRIAEFTRSIGEWPGRYLLMDPDEVIQDDPDAFGEFSRILQSLDAGVGAPDAARDLLQPWMPTSETDLLKFASQVFGAGA
jgi:hypothetical protein